MMLKSWWCQKTYFISITSYPAKDRDYLQTRAGHHSLYNQHTLRTETSACFQVYTCKRMCYFALHFSKASSDDFVGRLSEVMGFKIVFPCWASLPKSSYGFYTTQDACCSSAYRSCIRSPMIPLFSILLSNKVNYSCSHCTLGSVHKLGNVCAFLLWPKLEHVQCED